MNREFIIQLYAMDKAGVITCVRCSKFFVPEGVTAMRSMRALGHQPMPVYVRCPECAKLEPGQCASDGKVLPRCSVCGGSYSSINVTVDMANSIVYSWTGQQNVVTGLGKTTYTAKCGNCRAEHIFESIGGVDKPLELVHLEQSSR